MGGEPFVTLRGAAAPLFRANIDTDTISPGSRPIGSAANVPASPASSVTLAGELFAGWRYDERGEADPSFVLNRAEFRAAPILIAGRNFGCGSSRESAVWMLKEWGFRCIVAPSFGEIFQSSCFKNGLLPIQFDETTVAALAREAEPGAPLALFEVDLANDVVRTPAGATLRIDIPNIRREALLGGFDEIEQTQLRSDAIARFEAEAARTSPWLYAPSRPS